MGRGERPASTVRSRAASRLAAPVSTIFCRMFSITTWVRAESRVPISGSARIPSHSFTTGVDSSAISRCCLVRCFSMPAFSICSTAGGRKS